MNFEVCTHLTVLDGMKRKIVNKGDTIDIELKGKFKNTRKIIFDTVKYNEKNGTLLIDSNNKEYPLVNIRKIKVYAGTRDFECEYDDIQLQGYIVSESGIIEENDYVKIEFNDSKMIDGYIKHISYNALWLDENPYYMSNINCIQKVLIKTNRVELINTDMLYLVDDFVVGFNDIIKYRGSSGLIVEERVQNIYVNGIIRTKSGVYKLEEIEIVSVDNINKYYK